VASARPWTVFGLVLILGSVACQPKRPAFASRGYLHERYALEVLAPSGDGALLPPSWRLDNYYIKTPSTPGAGVSAEAEPQASAPADSTSLKYLRPKTSDEYTTRYELDYDGDGEWDMTVKEPTFALRFLHSQHDGRIFVRTMPLSVDQGEKRLDVLLHRYVEHMAGAGYELVEMNEERTAVIEKRYAAVLVGERPIRLANQDAHLALIDVANLDQIKVDPTARKERVEILLAHTPFVYETRRRSTATEPRTLVSFPVLLVIGYVNQPEYFAEGQKDFHDFANRLAIAGASGLSLPPDWSTVTSPQPLPTPPVAHATEQ
jgi:hypothetical protein